MSYHHAWRFSALVLTLVAFFALPARPTAAAESPQLKVEFDDRGISSLMFGQQELLQSGEMNIKKIYQGGKFAPDMSGARITFDKATRTKTWVYPFAKVTCVYEIKDNRLDFNFRILNTSNISITGLEVDVAELKLPNEPNFPRIHRGVMWTNFSLKSLGNGGSPIVLPANFGTGWAVLCSSEFEDRMSLEWNTRPGGQALAKLAVGGERKAEFRNDSGQVLIVANNFATYNVSLRFGPPGSANGLELADDICKAYAARHPMQLNWPDRRPIGRDFIGNLLPRRTAEPSMDAPAKTKADPAFRQTILENADRIIKSCKADNLQGVVLWDIEGDQYPQITYVGDPRLVEVLQPEMDSVADEFFKKFRDANLPTGVCIRPTQIGVVEKNGVKVYTHTDAGDPVAQLAAKIQYAMKRWGCTMFYIDTNVVYEGGEGVLLSAADMKALLDRFPNILLIPELGYADLYAYSFPYGQMDMGNRGTPALIKAIWPDCSQCTTPIDGYDLYDAMVKMLSRRETLMWFANNINTPVNHARAEAAFVMQGPPKDFTGANLEKKIGLLKSKDPLTRYFAIVELGESNNPKVLPALQACLGEKDWVLQRAAVAALGEIGDPKAIGPLTDILRQSGSDMQTFAAHALRQIGKPALPALLDAATNMDTKIALAAVSAIGGLALPEAATPMCRLADSAKANLGVRAKAIQALGLIGNDVADEKVISTLETASDATLVRAAVTAVTYGNVTGPRAVKAIEALIEREKAKLADKTVEKLDPKWMSLLGHALNKAKGK